ncbi:MAG: hypothetical protein KAG10_04360 [Methylococcales bacterium]|nr:hypothetical protein [Methylococcales bacterium]MCK5925105.1 hypothetical protein [Methylococcales bacterium]
MAGLFGSMFGGSAKTEAPRESTAKSVNTDGLTGVEKYLENQKPIVSATGVAKYLKVKALNEPSGVEKYLAKKSIASKQLAAAEQLTSSKLSGVAKYLNAQVETPKAKLSSVEKYLANNHSKSSVAKYVARRAIEIRNTPPVLKTTGVAHYLENRKVVLVTGVAKYVRKQVIETQKMVAETVTAVESAAVLAPVSGVERYLQARD